MVTMNLLNEYVSRGIADICPYGYDASHENHCAHFVSHVLNMHFGMTCATLKGQRLASAAANVRVHEIFAECPATQEIVACPTSGEGLIFVSGETSFRRRGQAVELRNVPKKHVGIILDGMVWHYSNSSNRVVTQTVAEFLSHYPRQQNALWWGSFPAMARPANFATSSG